MKEMAGVMFPGEWRVLLFVYAAVLLGMGRFGCLIGSLTMCVLLLEPNRPTKMRTHTTIIPRDFNAELGPGIGTERTH